MQKKDKGGEKRKRRYSSRGTTGSARLAIPRIKLERNKGGKIFLYFSTIFFLSLSLLIYFILYRSNGEISPTVTQNV